LDSEQTHCLLVDAFGCRHCLVATNTLANHRKQYWWRQRWWYCHKPSYFFCNRDTAIFSVGSTDGMSLVFVYRNVMKRKEKFFLKTKQTQNSYIFFLILSEARSRLLQMQSCSVP
jgi:hypothetical protein